MARIEVEDPIGTLERIHARLKSVGEQHETARTAAQVERRQAEQRATQSFSEDSDRLERQHQGESGRLNLAQASALQGIEDEFAAVERQAENLGGEYTQLYDDLKTRCRNVGRIAREVETTAERIARLSTTAGYKMIAEEASEEAPGAQENPATLRGLCTQVRMIESRSIRSHREINRALLKVTREYHSVVLRVMRFGKAFSVALVLMLGIVLWLVLQ